MYLKYFNDFIIINNKFLPPTKHEFLPGQPTVTNLINRFYDWALANVRSEPMNIFYLDFEKAFDKVQLGELQHLLEHIGIRRDLLGVNVEFI